MNSIIGVPHEEYLIYQAANAVCKAKREACKENLTDKKIEEIINEVIIIFAGQVSDINILCNFLNEQISRERQMPNARIMKSNEIKNSDWWTKYCDSNDCQHWERYYKHLLYDQGWDQDSIEKSVDLPTDEIMNALVDPSKEAISERRGMVVGYVQSGKTANYVGLINKAIDAGYKIIVVLAGMHNNLRSQTQSRVDEEVLGYETSTEGIKRQKEMAESRLIGVGKYNPEIFVQTLTSRDDKGDFNKARKGIVLSPTVPTVIVTKKTKSILENIYDNYYNSPYAQTLDDGTKKFPSKYPLLLIDDEADQASINNNFPKGSKEAEETEPSSINRLIRQILNLFEMKSYVGYTATPYANIFINNAEINPMYELDLFPKDFIVSLPKPKEYVGANEFFGSEKVKPMPLFREVVAGDFIDVKEGYVGEVPKDLQQAIMSFLIAIAIRNLRGNLGKPNSMLIHGARITDLQVQIKSRIENCYQDLKNQIINYDIETWNELKKLIDEDFIKTTTDMLQEESYSNYMKGVSILHKDDVMNEILRICKENKVSLYIINGKSKDILKYKDMEKEGKEYNVIAIGGDKLSRGLTLEGLSVSYFIRESKTYDTLMQMGRWFGFRKGYIDLCRVYTTVSLKKAFHKIAFATDDLRGQIEYMCDIEEQPATFGLKVAKDPFLKISNKIHNPVLQYLDFSNTLVQTRDYDKKADIYNNNFKAVDHLLRIAGDYIQLKDFNKKLGKDKSKSESFIWENVPGRYIQEFLSQYKTSHKAQKIKSYNLARYIEEQLKVGGLIEWTICLMNVTSDNGNTITGLANLPEIGGGLVRDRAEENCREMFDGVISLKSLKSNNHELIDCPQSIIDKVQNEKEKKEKAGIKLTEAYVRKRCREEMGGRTKGLLVLYPIDYRNKDKLTNVFEIPNEEHKTPFGFMIVFPDNENQGQAISYVLNPVAVGGTLSEIFD